MNIKTLNDYLNNCKTKRTVSTVEGLKQFKIENKHKYKIS